VNIAVIGLYIVSRTAGIPLGPEAGEAEGVDAPDTIWIMQTFKRQKDGRLRHHTEDQMLKQHPMRPLASADIGLGSPPDLISLSLSAS
jgi:hypothetical protein